jgi:predicted RNA binding protein YcfA (HicA-like mRNA interferase family)
MTRLPRITGPEIIRALAKAGFENLRQRGSHVFLKHQDGRATVVPVHGGEVLGPGIVSKILHDTEVTPDELTNLLHQ